MDQKAYWELNWKDKEIHPQNNFAKKCYAFIKNKRYSTLLDIGSGDGRDSIYFAKKGFKVTSIDFSKSSIKLLKNELNKRKISEITAYFANIESMNLKGNSFDIIYAHLSLQYFDDEITTKIFNKIFQTLKKGGIFFIKCKSTNDALYGKGTKISENIYIKGHLRHFFSKEYMRKKLQNFEILKIRQTSSTYSTYKSSFIEAIAKKT
jgi:cyclopropane fatty-acyl-phospholipid synthase-like methyltransferase